MNTPTPSAHSGEQGKPSVAKLLREVVRLMERGDVMPSPLGGCNMRAEHFMSLLHDVEQAARELERSEALERKHEQSEPVARDREADRKRFPDPAFNEWLDVGISDSGHTVWCSITNIEEAWAGWSNRPYYAPPPSEPEADDYREVMSKLSGPLRSIWAVMGPRVPRHWDCGGAAFEWGEALRILRDAANNAPPPSEQAGISCGTCEGTGLANVVDQDDGALVIDDCPECGGESRTAHPAPEAQADGEPVLYAPSDWEMELRIDGDVVVGRPSEFVVPLYLRPQPSASETPSAVDVSLLAYEAGWMACAEWAERDDLPADTGSYAYCCERDSRLAAIAAQTGVCAHCGRPAGGHTLACSSIRAEAIAAQRKEGES